MDTHVDAAKDFDAVDVMDWEPDDPVVTDPEGVRPPVPNVAVEDDPNALDPKDSSATTAKSSLTLRTLPQSSRHFWKTSHLDQVSQSMNDYIGVKRELPPNEIAVMALNEIAVERGHGFFFHLKSRVSGYKKSGKEELSPADRVAPGPGAQFPSMYYMRQTWTDKSRESFFEATYRSRYLICNGLINPPSPHTPLYAIQYVAGPKCPVYATQPESIVVLVNSSTYYLAKTSELETHVGLWPANKRPPQGADPEQRINTTPYIWNDDPADHAIALARFKIPGIEKLYEEIVKRCNPGNAPENLVSTFTAQEFRQIIPRPSGTNIGVALGTPLARSEHKDPSIIDESAGKRKASDLAGVNDSSNPPSRRQVHLKKPRTSKKGGNAGGRTGVPSNLVQQPGSDMGGPE